MKRKSRGVGEEEGEGKKEKAGRRRKGRKEEERGSRKEEVFSSFLVSGLPYTLKNY